MTLQEKQSVTEAFLELTTHRLEMMEREVGKGIAVSVIFGDENFGKLLECWDMIQEISQERGLDIEFDEPRRYGRNPVKIRRILKQS